MNIDSEKLIEWIENNKNIEEYGEQIIYVRDLVKALQSGEFEQKPQIKEERKMKVYRENYSIVRTEKAGVFAGNIVSRDGQEFTIKNCRRLWYWEGAASLSQLAVDGTSKPMGCKFTVTVDEMEVMGVIEVIPCTAKAEESLKGVKVWRA